MKRRIVEGCLVIAMLITTIFPANVQADEYTSVNPYGEPFKVESTAYYNKYNALCADGTVPTEGVTVAGKKEWLGKLCVIYMCEEDGSIGEFLGYYEFHDTGFGNDLDGDGIGSIQAGTCIDIYFEDKETCIEWGRKCVWIQVIDAVG